MFLAAAFSVFKWQSYQRDHLAQIEVSKLGGTYTLHSAAQVRDGGPLPSSYSRAIANPITEVDLSITSWPREKATIPPVTDNDIKVIVSLNQLQRLSLRGMPITDAAVDQLTRFQNLQYLDVRQTQISAQGLSRLKEALPSCEVVADHAG